MFARKAKVTSLDDEYQEQLVVASQIFIHSVQWELLSFILQKGYLSSPEMLIGLQLTYSLHDQLSATWVTPPWSARKSSMKYDFSALLPFNQLFDIIKLSLYDDH